jgi:hypothetical protein
MAVIVSLAFHIPQAEELEKRVKKMEDDLERRVKNFGKDKSFTKKKLKAKK